MLVHSVDTAGIEMSINKFGSSLGALNNTYYQQHQLLRIYVRDNALCLAATDFDARTRKICRVAQPETDTDAANKRYVDTSVNLLREEIEKKIIALETNVQIMMNEMQKIIQYHISGSAKDT